MSYKPPSIAAIHEFISKLEGTSRSRRRETLRNLKLLLNTSNLDAVLGGLIFEAEKIAGEYNYALVPSSLYSASRRCHLYDELNSREGLNNTASNPLDAKQKLIYLWHYYKFKKNAQAESKEMQSELSLDAELRPLVDNLLGQMTDLKAVVTTRHSLIEIQKRLKERPKKYEAEIQGRWFAPNAKHINFTKLIQIFNSDLMEKVIASFDDCKTREAQDQFRYSIYYGALLFIMKEIELDCAGLSTRKAHNSSLYQFCQKTLSIEHTDDIPDVIKLNFFVDFGKFISLAKANAEVMTLLKSYIRATLFSDANTFLDDMSSRLNTLLTEESYLWKCIKCLSNYAIQTLIVTACLEMGAGIYAAGVGVNTLPFIFGKLGRQFLGGAVGERLAIMLAKQVEPAFLPNLYASTIGIAGKKIHNWAFPPIDPVFNACAVSKKFRLQLHEEVSDIARKPDIFLLALMELPSTKIAANVKQRVKDIIIAPSLMHETTPALCEEPVKRVAKLA